MTELMGIFSNRVLGTALLAWAIAQGIKVILYAFMSRTIDFSRFVGAGGMPSSHSALVVSLSFAIGFRAGFDSSLYALSAAFAVIVMYDAAGVRRAAGNQAKLLNSVVTQLFTEGKMPESETLRELLGHTPIEVFAGAILGAVIAFLRG